LTPATSTNVWKTGLEKALGEQTIISSIAGDWVKALQRTFGWLALELLLYQNENLLTVSRKRRKRSSTIEKNA
jgi:hypothetical protein